MSNIKVGDLVMVVKPTTCCGNSRNIGSVFNVTDIGIESSVCSICFKLDRSLITKLNNGWVHVCRIIKIYPPAIDKSSETERELTA